MVNCNYIPFLFALLFCACQGHTSSSQKEAAGDTIPLRYATNLTLVRYADCIEATLRNPWDTTRVLHRYVLSHDAEHAAHRDEATLIHVPVRKAGVYSSVHCALIQEFGLTSSICGVCDSKYIRSEAIQRALADGSIKDFGDGMEPSLETIMDAMPDILMPSPFENSGGYGKLEQLGIPIVECADYMESSPLARAEWMKFYGILFGCEAKADSIFSLVEERYLALKTKGAKTTTHPRLVCELPSGGQWYVAAGQSTMGILYADAGADYIFSDLPGSGSSSLAFEQVFDRAQEADIWLLKYTLPSPLTLAQIAADTPLLTHLKAYRQQQVYGCNTTASGFYEDTPFHPDRLLHNLITILHPEITPPSPATYFKRLEP